MTHSSCEEMNRDQIRSRRLNRLERIRWLSLQGQGVSSVPLGEELVCVISHRLSEMVKAGREE